MQQPAENTPQIPADNIWMNIFLHWSENYSGRALDALEEMIHSHEARDTAHYSKYISIIQSSGMGKSRLASEASKEVFSICFTFRLDNSRGSPPGDFEMLEFLVPGGGGSRSSGDIHSRIGVLIAASLEIVLQWLQSQELQVKPGHLALIWHQEMQPVIEDDSRVMRSGARRAFCAQVVERGVRCSKTKTGRELCRMGSGISTCQGSCLGTF